MPELPEVETVVRGLREPLIGRTVQSIWYDWERIIHSPVPEAFAAHIIGQTFRAVNRRAKYILCELDHDTLLVHLKMTGRLYVTDNDAVHDSDRWMHFCLQLDNGKQLRFSDMRKFGRVYLTSDIATITGKLGPEPLDKRFEVQDFLGRFSRRHKNIKALLLDQTFIVGVGNIYADEALHLAAIHPFRRSDELSNEERVRLYSTIRQTLTDGIRHEGASVNWYRKPDGTRGQSQKHFAVYGREGQPCLTCGHPIEKIRIAGRGTHFCPICQPVRTESNVRI